MEATTIELAGSSTEAKFTAGQYNLFTSEVEPFPTDRPPLPGEAWLFDPDFGLVLPDDVSGKEILVEPGITLQFAVPESSIRGSAYEFPFFRIFTRSEEESAR